MSFVVCWCKESAKEKERRKEKAKKKETYKRKEYASEWMRWY